MQMISINYGHLAIKDLIKGMAENHTTNKIGLTMMGDKQTLFRMAILIMIRWGE